MKQLQDKVVVITGGGTGIGRATAKLVAENGARVAILGRRDGPLRETTSEIVARGGVATGYCANVAKSQEISNAVDRIISDYSKIDILFNNAGVHTGRGKSIFELTEEEWDEVLSVNLKGTFLCTRHIAPYMIRQNGGAIVNCSSISGHIAQRNQPAYNSSKGGIELFTKCMALDLAEYNIRVNAVCPAWIETELNREEMRSREMELIQLHPIGRIGTPEDVAKAVLFLVSDASSWITGTSLMVDGGYMIT